MRQQIDYGSKEINKLSRMYQESNEEIRRFILSAIIQIENDISCGTVINYEV
jgi:hypothetical protein